MKEAPEGRLTLSRSVLVDTGAWLAVFHRRDQYHKEAATELRRLREARTPLVVTDLVLAETHLHLLYGLGPALAADSLAILKGDPGIEEVFTDASLQQSALSDWIRRFTDQSFTLTDAVSFAVMRTRGIRSAFAFDAHFAVAGFRVLPERL
jgi:predicted nucleic acid-binding protein